LFHISGMFRLSILLGLLLSAPVAIAQEFSKADTLRGTLSSLRSCFDVNYYELDISIDLEGHTVSGSNTIHFKATSEFDQLQLDLFENLAVDSIVHQGSQLDFSRVHNAIFVAFPSKWSIGERGSISVYYRGKPIEAKTPPWDGGFIWKMDNNGKPHVGVACEGLGASCWWPNKDHLSDEPDSMLMHFTIPNNLVCVSNGQLLMRKMFKEHTRWTWKVVNPINNYNVTVNIGDYVQFTEYFNSGNDSLLLSYYVLRGNLEKAKEHFKQVKPMLSIFEEAFGRYPFWEDGYALVETPYAGMEHQSAIAYGNKFLKGYGGRFPSDMDFDYIIIHETGHEWWGNSVSANDLADMWVHESFCTYSESVYVEARYGYEKMMDYLAYQKNFITNRSPMRGIFGVNQEGNSTDMYYKGAWMLHTLRSTVNDDVLFKAILKSLATKFRHRNVDGLEIIDFIGKSLGWNVKPFFEQYIGHSELPILEYRLTGRKLDLRWISDVPGFALPMEIYGKNGSVIRTDVKQDEWTTVSIPKIGTQGVEFREDRFLFSTRKIGGERKKGPKF
jgi:aminopeptidase N